MYGMTLQGVFFIPRYTALHYNLLLCQQFQFGPVDKLATKGPKYDIIRDKGGVEMKSGGKE